MKYSTHKQRSGYPDQGVGEPNTLITPAKHRILSLALALCLVLGMTMYLPGPVEVGAASIGTIDDLRLDVGRTTYTVPVGSQIYFGSYSSSPILWRVVAVDGDTITLFCDGDVGRQQYRFPPLYPDNGDWSGSYICTWLNNTFLPAAFTQAEQRAIKAYGDQEQANLDDVNNGTIDISQQIVLPSIWEVGTELNRDGQWDMTVADRTYKNANNKNDSWWLRSPDSNPDRAALAGSNGYVSADGYLSFNGTVIDFLGISALYVRPAFKVNLSSVLFTSDANGTSKPSGTGASLAAAAPAGELKLTVVDSDLSLSNVTASPISGNIINFTYDASGTCSSLSAIVQREDGSISHYGRLKDSPSGTGSASVEVPANLALSDKLLVFVEEINGVNQTDYASQPVELVPGYEITSQPNDVNVSDGDLASFSVAASGNGLTYQWQESTNGGVFTDIFGETSDTYTIPAVDTAMDGNQYRVVVTDELQREMTSNAATLTVQALSTAKEITGFTIPGQQGNTVIDDTAETIELTMPYGTDASNLTPSITHTGTGVSPDSGVAQDFTDPVQYTVTAQDATTKIYTVTVWGTDSPSTGTAPTITTASLPDGKVDEAYSQSLSASGDAPITWTIDGGSLPLGLSLSGEGVISGTPTGAGNNGFTVKAENSHGSATKTLQIMIQEDEDGTGDGNGNGNGGGSSSPGSRSSSRSSGGSGTPDNRAAKAQLPASAFSWDGGRTLTIDHDSVSVLGLLSVEWDGQSLNRGTDYAVYSGSVIIRFSGDLVSAQTPGDHTVRVEFLNHTGENTVTVGSSRLTGLEDTDTHNPSTGGYPDRSYPGATDNPNTGNERTIWPALLLGSLGAAMIAIRVRKGKAR